MSIEKYQNDSKRWYAQSEADLKAARSSKKSKNYEWACFQAQQAGEKALKALWLYFQYDPRGHSLLKLIQDYPDKEIYNKSLLDLKHSASLLDKLYIPTRYPNGLPELSPFEVYSEDDAGNAIKAGQKIIQAIKLYIDEKKTGPSGKNE